MSLLPLITEISRILLNTPEASLGLSRSLNLLASELGVSSICVGKNSFNEENNRVYVENIYEWYADDSVTRIGDNMLAEFSYEDIYEIFSTTLAVGKPFYGRSSEPIDTSSEVAQFYRENNLKSYFIAPIYFNSTHWGNLSILDYEQERDWSEIESELTILSGILSFHIKEADTRSIVGQELSSCHSIKMATLGEMASGIAHEINNPLFVINGYASKIDSSIDRGILDVHELKNISKMIQRHCKRVTSIISGLRLISRKSKLDDLEVRNLRDVVESTLDISKERIRLGGISLRNNMLDNKDYLVECHPEQISQVIVNLLNNSYDSISCGSHDKWIDVDIKELDDRIIFSLADSGQRVPRDVARNMMQPFYTTKDADKGTGLGLSISKEIILKHGGNFYLDDHCENMKFIIELPKLSYE